MQQEKIKIPVFSHPFFPYFFPVFTYDALCGDADSKKLEIHTTFYKINTI